jgi:MFS family permease
VLTLLLEALDQILVGTTLPRIVASLQGHDRYTWAVTSYTLGSCSLIPIVGKLYDQFGRKWFLIGGTVLFLLGSALSGLSQTMNQLIAFRALQGIGAGMGIALAFTVVADIFPPAERAKWSGLFGGVYGVASVLGPSLGGWLTDHGPLVGNLVTDATCWPNAVSLTPARSKVVVIMFPRPIYYRTATGFVRHCKHEQHEQERRSFLRGCWQCCSRAE